MECKYVFHKPVTISRFQQTQGCTVTVVVGVDAELDEDLVADVNQAEDIIVSQWKELSADEQHQYRNQVDEIFRLLAMRQVWW